MNKQIKKLLIIIGSLLFSILGMNHSTLITSAAEESTGMGFSVEPILPVTQIDQELGYFYIKTEPNQEQTFEVKVSSSKKEKQVIKMSVEDAYTGSNGGLTFGVDGVNNFKQDETLINATSQLVKPSVETVELAPGEEKIVSFKVNPPSESYPGAKIGRIVFKQDESEESSSKVIVDEYQYAINVVLAESGDAYSDGDLNKLNLKYVKPTIARGKRLVVVNLQNPEPKRMMNIEMLATITKKDSDKIIKKTEISDFQFAPNSNVDLEIDWGLSQLEAGDYTVNITAKNKYDNIRLTEDFRITADDAKKINNESAFKIITPTWVKVTAISNGVIALLLTVLILIRNKKWEKLVKKKRNKKRNKKR